MIIAIAFFLFLVFVVGVFVLIGKINKAFVRDEGIWAVTKLEVALAGLMLFAILIWFALRVE